MVKITTGNGNSNTSRLVVIPVMSMEFKLPKQFLKYLKEDKNYISFEAYNYLILLSIVFDQNKILNLLLGNQIKQSNDPVVQMIMHPAYYAESKFKEIFNSKHIANLFHSHNSNSHYTLIAIGVLTDNKTFP